MEGKPGKGGGAGKRAGLAPFASLEDLSDESPPDDKCRLTLPGIREDQTPAGAASGGGQRPSITPRIDISRASSSSHHDDSSPERELFTGSTEGTGAAKIGLGFSEEMALELRSSTEELDFHDPEEETKTRRKKLHHQQQAVTKYELEAQSEKESRERKDSACSEGGLLFIGGRTSRLSSIGSVVSGGSVASHISGGSGISGNSHLSAASHASHVSGQSHLSAVSNYSRASRCSSPHRMLLETSFCGPKPIPTLSLEAEYPPNESVEAALLARKTDITGAILPNDESIKMSVSTSKAYTGKATLEVKPAKSGTLEVKTKPRSNSERITKTSSGVHQVQPRSSSARANLKQARPKLKKSDDNELVKIIPLHGSLDEPEDANAMDTAEDEEEPVEASSGAFTPEYGIYIPLKGPIIDYSKTEEAKSFQTKPKVEVKTNKPEIEESDLVRFISLHGEDDEAIQKEKTDSKKYNFRNGQNVQFKPWTDDTSQYGSQKEKQLPKKSRSPEPMSKCKPTTLNISSKNGRPAQSLTQLPRDESRTPSPATSFARGAFFRRSSDSSGGSKKSGSTDKMKKDSRNKSMFTSLFKKNVKEAPVQKRVAQDKSALDPKITNVEFKFKQEDVDTIIIPLHSPDSVIEPCMTFDPEAISAAVEHEEQPKRYVRKQYYETRGPDHQTSENHITGKNIIVVDVIKEDTKEPPEPVAVAVPLHTAQETTHSKSIGRLELEDLEYEPRVRKSISHGSTKEMEGKLQERKEETDNQIEFKKAEEKIVSPKVVPPLELVKSPVEPKAISPTEEKPLLDETVSDRSPVDELSKEERDETEERRSSESEIEHLPREEPKVEECDEERKGLFLQNDSIEDELPYIPTTLPQERSVAVPIIPIRQRMSEVKTCPVERPRSTTPIQPSNLDEYAATHDGGSSSRASQSEKMQIILPRTDSIGRSKSPGRPKPWMQFAEECLQSPKETRKAKGVCSPPPSTPPPLPPRGSASSAQWVMFDELQPERRRTPRRITTLPLRQQQTSSSVVYSYVNPEECSCECHESQGKVISSQCTTESEQCSYKKGSRTEKERRYRT